MFAVIGTLLLIAMVCVVTAYHEAQTERSFGRYVLWMLVAYAASLWIGFLSG